MTIYRADLINKHLILFYLLLFGVSVRSVNITFLLEKYVLLCGNQLCDNIFRDIPDSTQYTSMCSPCECDTSCFLYGTCCPDIYFSFDIQCVNTSFFSHLNNDNENFFLMKTSCPKNSNVDLKHKCEGSKVLKEKFQTLPVTSNVTYFTYLNVYCAECHNDTNDLLPWTLDTICKEFVDFNFISSFDEIITTVQKKKCKMSSSIEYTHIKGCYNSYDTDVVRMCNVTGTWLSYDENIEWACKHYDNQYYIFKNVYCYMCNPPIETQEFITHCNVTGLWTRYDSALEMACTNLDKTTTTYPFNNIYCYFCNIESSQAYKQYYLHSLTKIEETLFNKQYFNYSFEIEYVSDIYISRMLSDYNVSDSYISRMVSEHTTESTSQSVITKQNVNMDSIYTQYYAMTANGHFCRNITNLVLSDVNEVQCSCSDTCHFYHQQPCCVDAAFQYSTCCIDYNNQRFLVYDGCDNQEKEFENLSNKCNRNDENSDDLLLSLPVYDIQTSVSYKNIYCGLCRQNKNITTLMDDIKHFKPWRFQLTCKQYIPFQYIVLFSGLFEEIAISKCNITVIPNENDQKCSNKQTLTTRDKSKPELIWACQAYNIPPFDPSFYYKLNDLSLLNYSNIFCAMADADIQVGPTISICNSTGIWNIYDKETDNKCQGLPKVAFHFPYKNIFCKMCNMEYVNYTINNTVYVSDVINYDGIVPHDLSFRTLFTFTFYANDKTSSSDQDCGQDQMYDSVQGKCRDIMCYPGRVLINGTCKPLLPYTSNLGYIVSIGAVIRHNITMDKSFLKSLNQEVVKYVGKFIGLSYPIDEYLVLKVNKTCSSNNLPSDYSFHYVTMFIKIFVSSTVDRDLIETKLVNLYTQNITFTIPCTDNVGSRYCNIRCKFTYDAGALNLPLWIHLKLFEDDCFLETNGYILNADLYVYSIVNELLLCPQVEFDTFEFSFITDKTQISITSFNTMLDFNEFYITKNNTVRICKERFHQLLESDSEASALKIVLRICTILSLIALFVTFITYCLFSVLRTLPGKNNMSMIIATFFALVLLEFGLDQTKHYKTCIVIGVFIHYFWLCMFGCLNVCSFHMFRTFRSKEIYINDKRRERKLCLLYLLYSYGCPALIVSLNLLLSTTLLNSSNYGYGNGICFISNKIATIIAFITPVVIICLTNLFFFVLTALSIASTPTVKTDDIQTHNRINFSIYVKLFIITGCVWIIQVLDSVLPVSAFSIIVSFLNSFQGIYIFVSYICNKRVFILYKHLFRNTRQHSSTQDSSSTTFLSLIRKRMSQRKNNTSNFIQEDNMSDNHTRQRNNDTKL